MNNITKYDGKLTENFIIMSLIRNAKNSRGMKLKNYGMTLKANIS